MTNGVSGNSVYRFIKYLSENGSTAAQVFSDADVNSNGCTKTELKKYLENLDCDYLSGSDASKIFSTFNTNTSGKVDGTKVKNKNVLTDDEAAQAEEYVEKYEAVQALLDAVLSGENSVEFNGKTYEVDIDIPDDGLMSYVSRSSLEESLMNSFDKNMDINNLDKILGKAIAKSGADGYAQHYIDEYIDDYSDQLPSGYTVADDDLQGLIDSYIKSLDGTNLDLIKGSIEAIVKAYFNTIGVGIPVDLEAVWIGDEDAPINLSRFGWKESKGLNDLQLKMITDAVSEKVNVSSLGIDLTNSKNKKLFEQAVSDFIKEQYSGQDDYDEIMELVEDLTNGDFINSNAGQVFIIMTLYADFSNPTSEMYDNNAYYQALVDAFGEDFASRLAEADSTYGDGELYNTILQQVADMVRNGEIEPVPSTIRGKIVELIAQNYQQFAADLGLSSSGASVDALYNNFNNLANNSNAQLSAVRTAAISFLDSVSALGNSKLNAEIKAQFGDDYATTIQGLRYKQAIIDGVNAVNTKYTALVNSGAIIDMDNLNVSADNLNTSVRVGGTATIADASMAITGSNGQQINSTADHRITYSAASIGGYCNVSIDTNTGKNLVINAGDVPITDTIEVKVYINGQEVGTREISVEIRDLNMNATVSDLDGTNYTLDNLLNRGTGRNDIASQKLVDAVPCNQNPAITALNGVTGCIVNLASAFASAGYSSAAVAKAQETMINYYTALLLNGCNWSDKDDLSGIRDTQFSYYNSITGSTESTSSDVAYHSATQAGNVDEFGNIYHGGGYHQHSDSDNVGYASSGIYIGKNEQLGNDQFYVYVDMGELARKFASFLAQAEAAC